MNVLQTLQERFHDALTGLVPDPAPYAAMVKPAQDARHGDYQANCAMSLAKVLGKPPRTVAQTLVERLRLDDLLEPPEIAGPGFINLRLRTTGWRGRCRRWRRDDRLGVAPVVAAEDVRDRLQLAERGQADARRPPAQHDHRRRPGPAAALPGPPGRHRQPPRRLGHAVRHPAVRLQASPRRGGVPGRPGAGAGPAVPRSAEPVQEEDGRRGGGRRGRPGAGGVPAGDGEAARRRPGESCGCGRCSCPPAWKRSTASTGGWTCISTTRSARASTTRCCRAW